MSNIFFLNSPRQNIGSSIKPDSTAMYLRISRAIRDDIKNGRLKPAEALPSARNLANQLRVNRHTIMAAYQELIAEGWIGSRQRKGYFVMSPLPVNTSATTVTTVTPQTFEWRLIKKVNPPSSTEFAQYTYNFAGGCPDISLFPYKQFSVYTTDALNRPNLTALNYGNNRGHPPLIEQIEIYLRRARSLVDKKIVIVNGSQEALFLLSRVLLKPGDKVAVEKLGYQPAWAAFRDSGASLIGVNQDHHGIDPNHLESLAQQHQLRLIYLTPLHQYPTTVTLSISRRLQIYQIAVQYKIPIIEDDYDHEFHYRCQPLAPMAADDPYGLVIYLSTFSKIMFPGIRLGFIALDPMLADTLINYRSLVNHKPAVPLQDAIARWMADGAFERQLRKLTRNYEKRRDNMADLLADYKNKGLSLDYIVPDGGMAMWVKIAADAECLAQRAIDKGIYVQSENEFHLHPSNSENRYLRLGFAGMDEQRLTQGLELLFSGIK